MGEILLPTQTQDGSGDIPSGQGDAEKEYKKKKKKMKHLKTFESFKDNSIDEAYDGDMSDFKYEFPMRFEEATGNSPKAIKGISKKGKNQYQVNTSTYMSEREMKSVADAMGMSLVSYRDGGHVKVSVFEATVIMNESIVTEGKGFKNTVDFEKFLIEIDGMGDYDIKKIMGKDHIDTPGFYQDEKKDYDGVLDFMRSNMGQKEFDKLESWWENNVAESVQLDESMSSYHFDSPNEFDQFSDMAPEKGETKYLVMANNRASFNGQEIRLEGETRFGSTSKKQILGIFEEEDEALEVYKSSMKSPQGTMVSFTMGTLVGSSKFRSQYTEIQGYLATAKIK